jgi:hypothetical protein
MVSMSLVLVNNTGKPHMGTHTYQNDKIFLLIVLVLSMHENFKKKFCPKKKYVKDMKN